MLLPIRTSHVMASALGALAFVALVGCGDDSDAQDGSGGATSSTVTGSAASTSSTSSSNSSSSGLGGSADGSGGAGGDPDGIGGSPDISNGTGGGGGGGAWTVPACDSIAGTNAVTFTTDDGDTITDRELSLSGVSYAISIVALDTPNTLVVANAGVLQRSTDAGCTYEDVGAIASDYAMLVAAQGGRTYGFGLTSPELFSYDGEVITTLVAPGGVGVVAIGTDPADGSRIRLVLSDGSLWDSSDAGASFAPRGEAAPDQCVYTAAVDPTDLDHVVCGTVTTGAWLTTNGGESWTRAETDVNFSNAFTIAISPADANVVWVQGYELGLNNGQVVGIDQRHVWRSTDGGASFTTVFVESTDVVEGDDDQTHLFNGNPLAAHPTDIDVLYYTFGTPPTLGPNVADLYRVDASTGDIHVEMQTGGDIDDYGTIAFNPADPSVIYLPLSSERPQGG